jgi:hypothetical protein
MISTRIKIDCKSTTFFLYTQINCRNLYKKG